MDMYTICTDLQGEQNARDTILANLDEAGWNTPTPAPMGDRVSTWAVRALALRVYQARALHLLA
jgi:hypothetical protein